MIDLEAIKRRVEALKKPYKGSVMDEAFEPHMKEHSRALADVLVAVPALVAEVETAREALQGLRYRMLQDGPCWCVDGHQQFASWQHEAACVSARRALLGP